MGSRKNGPRKHKDHAQDCETRIAKESSVRRSCHGLYLSDGIHPFGSTGILPRPAAGLLLDVLAHDRLRKPEFDFRKNMRKTRATCARELQLNDECCAFRAAPCNAPRPSA